MMKIFTMRFSRKHKFLLISNWKCGCSKIANMFAPYSDFDFHSREQCKSLLGVDYSNLVHAPYKIIDWHFRRNDMRIGDFFTISSVRNPWARSVSLYHSLKNQTTVPSFDVWVRNGLPKWRSGINNRWNTYEMFHNEHGELVIDHVIRLEHLKEDLEPIARKYWPAFEFDYNTVVNPTEHLHYSNYYNNDELIQIVAEHFKYDIETWGYKFMSQEN